MPDAAPLASRHCDLRGRPRAGGLEADHATPLADSVGYQPEMERPVIPRIQLCLWKP